MDREALIKKGKQIRDEYEQKNKLPPEQIAGLPMYIPVGEKSVYCLHYPSKTRKNGPVFFDIHGGGFLWGYPEEDDLFCRNLNETLDIEVYSLDYLRSPEHMFPDALLGLYDTIRYMAEHADEYHFDPAQISIGGHSAGGNLAAAVALLNLRRQDFAIRCQVLDYPAVDNREGAVTKELCKDDPVLPFDLMEFFRICYLKKEDEENPLCNPICAGREELKGLPPAVLMTCENDVLRFQGREYSRKLIEANVPVLHYEYPGVCHAFDVFEGPDMKGGQDYLIRGLKFFMGL